MDAPFRLRPLALSAHASRNRWIRRGIGPPRCRLLGPDHTEARFWSVHEVSGRASWAATPSPSPFRATGGILPHIHVSARLKAQSADGRTSHLLSVKVQFLSVLLIVEVTSPTMTSPRNPDLCDVPLLTFG